MSLCPGAWRSSMRLTRSCSRLFSTSSYLSLPHATIRRRIGSSLSLDCVLTRPLSISACLHAARSNTEENAHPEPTKAASAASHSPISSPPTSFSFRPYAELMRLDRPAGSYLLFMPCSWSITMASHFMHAPTSVWLSNLGLFAVGSFIMRGAGCTINDMWDAKMDAKVERTKTRPIASGRITHGQATIALGLQLAAGLVVLLQLNTYSIILGSLALVPVTLYPLMKRVTNFPQVGMGLAFTWGSMLGWSAVAGACYWPAVLPLYASTVTWGVAYDLIYAQQDKTDDKAAGVGSMALLLSDKGTKRALVALSVVWMALLVYAVQAQSPIFPSFTAKDGSTLSLHEWVQLTFATGHPFFAASWLATVAHIYWQIHTLKLNNRMDCWAKFCSNRSVGLIIFTGLAADYLYQWANSCNTHDKSELPSEKT